MRIVLVNEEYPSETSFGGIATYQKIVAEEYTKMGHDVTVICRGLSKYKEYKENGVNIIRIYEPETNNKKRDYIRYRKQVKNVLLKLQSDSMIDIIETPDWGAETIFFEKYRKVPLVVRLHTPLKVWLKYNKNDFGNITHKMLKWERKMINNADMVTCCSNALLHEMRSNFKNLDNVKVTPNPANLDSFYRNKDLPKEHRISYIGSIEERKGVIVLAKALNIVLKRFPNLKVGFVGKDTKRNDKNISTIEYIYSLVDRKYHKNLKFYGQVDDKTVSYHMNKSLVGVYPSLFDNFPYVVLESMATGLQIVGSSNSGMVEMLGGYGSIYESGNVESLAEKIIERYEIAKKQNVNNALIERVKSEYNTYDICQRMIKLYENIISKYYEQNINEKEVMSIVEQNFNTSKFRIKLLSKKHLANTLYMLKVDGSKYVLKKYNYNYNFELCHRLYDVCEKNSINIIKPVNDELIKIGDNKYNIFKYVENKRTLKKPHTFFKQYLLLNRSVDDRKDYILEKVNNYVMMLGNIDFQSDGLKPIIDNVIRIYNSIDKNNSQTLYLNHGDISKNNIIYNKGYYLIDFDEAIVGNRFYDLAVIAIKFYTKGNTIDTKKIFRIADKSINNVSDRNQVICAIKLYLCKVLLEKFYLHLTGKINLYDRNQKKDDYMRYYNLLLNME